MTITGGDMRYTVLAGRFALVLALAWAVAGCVTVRWATVRVRNLSSETMRDVRLTGVDPDVAFGLCRPNADASTSLGDSITFHPDVAMEYSIGGRTYRQSLNKDGVFPAKLPNRDKIIELQFTTNRVWTWTLKEGRIVE